MKSLRIFDFKFLVMNSKKGMALILTLMILALITAMVTEFAYGVYTGTNILHNWYESQRLSFYAGSGVNVAINLISDTLANSSYTPGFFDAKFDGQSQDNDGEVLIRIEDENSKFNVNTIVDSIGTVNDGAYKSFRRLLSNLRIDENIADYVADWIDPDTEERLSGSEYRTKNAPLYNVGELMFIKGIDTTVYEKLFPYVTVYGNGRININGAEKPVLISLSNDITDELAQRVIDYRRFTPFEEKIQLQKVIGFDLLVYGPISGKITVKGGAFYVRSIASSGGIKRIIEAVIGMNRDIKYWRES
ncbi:MAG: type II secretion system minor pseudopilin GspK [Nitrospirae bacterium]|nr:type II secretion system minor pseudopilin GspK [Nitrospirota bacterium]